MESTYGDRNHRDLDATVAEFEAVLQRAVARGGNVIIPSFALERAQEILFVIGRAIASGRLPAGLQVFLDSPMASAATRIFRRHGAALRPEIGALLERGRDPFTLPGLHVTRDAAQSRALGRLRGGAVIIAGSGMCTGGRVRHHLRRNLARAENAVVFVGFAAQGTLARILIDGAPSVRLSGDEIPVRASLHTIGGFSAHAGRDDLIDWHRRAGAPGRVFLVHGEDAPRRALAGGLEPAEVILPALHEGWDL
ncbi:MAG: hypothetical protein KatS3mg118_2650 [Paracoccaceae bacterium]|nr:MAG: hypothetical protein KatS3mg118_2650 [Paracoccaceae bacterium]